LPGHFTPPPQPEEDVDEKTRLRRTQDMLLPSQPDLDIGVDPSAIPQCLPSAPNLPEHDCVGESHTARVDSVYLRGPLSSSAAPISMVTGGLIVATPGELGPPSPSSGGDDSGVLGYQDDKQELERRRLLVTASAPDYP